MAAGPRYIASTRTAEKTPLPTATPLLRVTQLLASNGWFFGSTSSSYEKICQNIFAIFFILP
jgi:hypothetical protein